MNTLPRPALSPSNLPTVTATHLRHRLKAVINRVHQKDQPVVVTVADRPKVVVADLVYFEELRYRAGQQ